jgi:hypothetical protein
VGNTVRFRDRVNHCKVLARSVRGSVEVQQRSQMGTLKIPISESRKDKQAGNWAKVKGEK